LLGYLRPHDDASILAFLGLHRPLLRRLLLL
jgi:hypothetical protein